MPKNKSPHLSKILHCDDVSLVKGITRRDFITYSAGAVASVYLSSLLTGCGSDSGKEISYPIDSTVVTTAERVISFPMPAKPSGPNSGTGLYPTELSKISEYAKYGYGNYTFGGPLPVVPRYDLMPRGYRAPAETRLVRFARFFTLSDVHLTDKETPIQLIYMQQENPVFGAAVTSIYSPIMMYTPHVLDAAVQTINALHQQAAFDFGMYLGDVCNSTQYNELRWYLDIMDGKFITPSSGAHLGADTIEYQKPFQSAGLDPSIPWYQVLGNHDHFLIGSVAVDADPSLGLREAFVSDKVWASGNVLVPQIEAVVANPSLYPCLFDCAERIREREFYMGVLDGATPNGDIIDAGKTALIGAPPIVAADPDRRSLLRTEWINEFFNTASSPTGHGLGLVDPAMGEGFACYSFLPNPSVPLKVIALDDTQSELDGSHDIHGHGFLDKQRWNWLKRELADGQAANQLMIIAAHIPIGVSSIGSATEWWESSHDPNATMSNAVDLKGLVAELQNAPNVLMWIAGHRHLNTVKAFRSLDDSKPERGFWQVETSSLHDFPQQFRTFEIYLNSDYTVSIRTVNVDPAVAPGTPAATSRTYAIATQQICQTDLTSNAPNVRVASGFGIPVESMDPTRPQDGTIDPTIEYGSVGGVPLCPSYNAELFKQLTPQMVAVLKELYPAA